MTLSGGRKKGFGEGKSPARFSFTYSDLAQALGCSTEAARKHAQRGNFDPHSLLSVLEFIQVKLSKDGPTLKKLVEDARSETKGEE